MFTPICTAYWTSTSHWMIFGVCRWWTERDAEWAAKWAAKWAVLRVQYDSHDSVLLYMPSLVRCVCDARAMPVRCLMANHSMSALISAIRADHCCRARQNFWPRSENACFCELRVRVFKLFLDPSWSHHQSVELEQETDGAASDDGELLTLWHSLASRLRRTLRLATSVCTKRPTRHADRMERSGRKRSQLR